LLKDTIRIVKVEKFMMMNTSYANIINFTGFDKSLGNYDEGPGKE